MRIALTGATGFIGGHVARHLSCKGHDVLCLCRPGPRIVSLQSDGLRVAEGQLDDEEFLAKNLSDVDVLIHAAAKVSDWGTISDILHHNVEVTRCLLRVSEKCNLSRFVFFSTTDVYGHPGTPLYGEHIPAKIPRFNWYAESKRIAERHVTASHVPWVILRPATVFGPGSIYVVLEIAMALRTSGMLTINGGRSDAGLVSINTVLEAVEKSLENERALREAFNISQTLKISWHDLLQDLAAELGFRPKTFDLPYPVANALACLMEKGYRTINALTKWKCRTLLSRQAVQILAFDQSFDPTKARTLLGLSEGEGYQQGLLNTAHWLKKTYKNLFA